MATRIESFIQLILAQLLSYVRSRESGGGRPGESAKLELIGISNEQSAQLHRFGFNCRLPAYSRLKVSASLAADLRASRS